MIDLISSQFAGYLTFGLLLSGVVFFGFKYWQTKKLLKEAELKLVQLRGSVDTIKLENLEAKLNPHLFKNVLNSIQSHAFQTYQSLDQLANVLDYILYESRQGFVSPKEEIEFARSLIEINRVKLSPLFELHVKIKTDEADPAYTQKKIAPMILVDMIENAFKHTDLQSADSFIKIVLEWNKAGLTLLVTNKVSSKSTLKKPQSGFGTHSLEQRLEILHPGQFTLRRYQDEDRYIAQLNIYPDGKDA